MSLSRSGLPIYCPVASFNFDWFDSVIYSDSKSDCDDSNSSAERLANLSDPDDIIPVRRRGVGTNNFLFGDMFSQKDDQRDVKGRRSL